MESKITPKDLVEFLRDIVETTSRQQSTIPELTKSGFVFWLEEIVSIPSISSSFLQEEGADIADILEVPVPSAPPAPPTPDSNGVVQPAALEKYQQAVRIRREHKELYDQLFDARSTGDSMELVLGVGLLTSDSEDIFRHLVAIPTEIELDTRTGTLLVRALDIGRVELSWLDGTRRIPFLATMDLLADVCTSSTPQLLEENLRELVVSLGTQADFTLRREKPKGDASLGIGVHPALLFRKKDTSSLLALLENLSSSLDDENVASAPLKMLVSEDYKPEPLAVMDHSVALPLPANTSQRTMIDRSRSQRHLVVQGPPGTGKTHTIANLASVLIAEGRRVLITAENEHALKEVQGKLPLSMQPLMLPFFRERNSATLEAAVNGILARAGASESIDRLDRQIAQATERLKTAQLRLAELQDQLIRISESDREERTLNETSLTLAGHLKVLRSRTDDLELVDRFLASSGTIHEATSREYIRLHQLITEEHLQLSRFVFPKDLMTAADFAQVVSTYRGGLAVLPDPQPFDYSQLASTSESLESLSSALHVLPTCRWSDFDGSPEKYAQAKRSVDDVAVNRRPTDPTLGLVAVETAIEILEAYLNLEQSEFDQPLTDLINLYTIAANATGRSALKLPLKADADVSGVLPTWEKALDLLENDRSGLLHEFVRDNHEQGFGRVSTLITHAMGLLPGLRLGQGLRITVSDGASSDHGLQRQARGLLAHLKAGGKLTRVVGTPRPVTEAREFLSRVRVEGAEPREIDEIERAIAFLQHRMLVEQAKDWGSTNDLNPPSEVAIPDWLESIANIPQSAELVDSALISVRSCTQFISASRIDDVRTQLQAAIASAYQRTADALEPIAQAYRNLVQVSSMTFLAVRSRDEAQETLDSLLWQRTRLRAAAGLPGAWLAKTAVFQTSPSDELSHLLGLATTASSIPVGARIGELTPSSVRTIINQISADERRHIIVRDYQSALQQIRDSLKACTPASPSANAALAAAEDGDPKKYQAAVSQIESDRSKASMALQHERNRSEILSTHERLVLAYEIGDPDAARVLEHLDSYQRLRDHRVDVDQWRQDVGTVEDVHHRLADEERALRTAETDLAEARCWRSAAARLASKRQLASSLSALSTAMRSVPKTHSAKSYPRRIQAVRDATRSAAPAIPCWIMSIDRVSEILNDPSSTERFDVVIIDEASQAWFPSIFLYAIAEQVVIVGDDLQTSPGNQVLQESNLVALSQQHIKGHRIANLVGGDLSLYDVAMTMTAPETMVDHFRCVPEIIDLSNRLAYEPNGKRLMPSRTRQPNALEPILHFQVDGQRLAGQINVVEAEAIINSIVTCHSDPVFRNMTFGVVVVGTTSAAHIKYLKSKLLEILGPTAYEERMLEVGTAAEFQGAERNVIFLSLLDVPEEGRQLRVRPLEYSGLAKRFVQQLNVAVSRAKDQLRIYRSFDESHLKENDARLILMSSRTSDSTEIADQLAKCQSEFEKDVIRSLIKMDPSLRIRTQVEAIGYSIDIVVEDIHGHRLAVECDGDRWHTSNSQIQSDLYRQRTLENIGWRFYRFLSSEWYGSPEHHTNRILEEVARARPAP
jgi:very-short-patch-repair endonuclease